MESIIFIIMVVLLGLTGSACESLRDEQIRHNKQLEKILKEQTDLLVKIEQENRLIRIALHRPKIEALYDELKR